MQIDSSEIAFARKVIAAEVRGLIRRGTFRAEEAENLSSELMARLLATWSRYDPTRGSCEAFINVVVASQAVSLVREKCAQKRRGRVVPFDSVAGTLEDRTGSGGRGVEDLILRIDMEGALELLTPFQRRLLDLLQHDPLARVAQRLGVPRRTLRDERDRIRAVFRDAGLEAYLRRPAT